MWWQWPSQQVGKARTNLKRSLVYGQELHEESENRLGHNALMCRMRLQSSATSSLTGCRAPVEKPTGRI